MALLLKIAEAYTHKTEQEKELLQGQLELCLKRNQMRDGTVLTAEQRNDYRTLVRWLEVNKGLGEEFCPASSIETYRFVYATID